jgi:hypothetical protein
MLDRDWPSPADLSAFRIDLPGLIVTTIDPGPMTIVAGQLDAALRHVGLDQAYGWPGTASGPNYAIRTSVDRVLVVGHELAGGWHGAFGATQASDAMTTFVLQGPALPAALLRLGEITLSRPSASASFLIAGYRTVLYQHEGALRLHVSRPLVQGFAGHLAAVMADLAA